jgi:hypothetical protein
MISIYRNLVEDVIGRARLEYLGEDKKTCNVTPFARLYILGYPNSLIKLHSKAVLYGDLTSPEELKRILPSSSSRMSKVLSDFNQIFLISTDFCTSTQYQISRKFFRWGSFG